MPRRKRSTRREKQARKGRTATKQGSRGRSKDQTQQQMNGGQPDIANLTSSSGRTVRELVDDLSKVANQLGKTISVSAEPATTTTASISEQTEREMQRPSQPQQDTFTPPNQGKYTRTQEAA